MPGRTSALLPAPGVPPPPPGVPGECTRPATAAAPSSGAAEVPDPLELASKGRPPIPPSHLHQPPKKSPPKDSPQKKSPEKVKEEPPSSPKGGFRGVVDVTSDPRPASSKKKSRSKSRSRRRRDHSKRRDRSRRGRRSESGKKGKRRSRSSTRRRRSAARASSVRGRSKKRRSEKPPEPPGPPPSRRDRPQEPPYPPPGRGWVGYLPRSDHPRWTDSTNKGQVKRAKQERFNNRRRR